MNTHFVRAHFSSYKLYYKYTLGQRKGVNVSRLGKNYVLEIKADTNEIVIGRNKDLRFSQPFYTMAMWFLAAEKLLR